MIQTPKGLVVVHAPNVRYGRAHERSNRAEIARRLAALKGYDFAGPYDSARSYAAGLGTQVNGPGWHAPCGAPRTASCTGRARSWSKIAQRSRVSAAVSQPQVTNRASPSQFC